jgi:phytoene synthase
VTAVLEESYATCRELHRRHGTTYWWAARLLPRERRPYVHALYGFCRYADDIVDDLGPAPVAERERALDELGRRFFADLASGSSDHPVLAAVVDTVRALDIDPECVDRFLRSMAMDLTVTEYETYGDLCVYMDGSAAVIGEMMLPVLDPTDRELAFGPARDLGLAFQLTNFLRDVGEDLDRGRVYLPQEDLRRYGADPWRREVTPAWRELMADQIARARDLYRSADAGLAHLPPRSAACVGAARILYGEILDAIEANGYDVFTVRARVSTRRKVAVAARSLLGTIGARKP